MVVGCHFNSTDLSCVTGSIQVIGEGAVAIAAGYQPSMVTKKDDSVRATGKSGDGQFGDKSKRDKTTYERITGVNIIASMMRFFLLCFLVYVFVYYEALLSSVRSADPMISFMTSFGATRDSYLSLFCNIDSENELECLVHMRTQMTTTSNCSITTERWYGRKTYDFCGAFAHAFAD